MPLLTKEQIQERNRLKVEEVQVPEWGGSVKIRELTLEQFFEVLSYEASLAAASNGAMSVGERNTRVAARAVSMALVDMEFTEQELLALGRSSGIAVTQLLGEVLRLCGSTPAVQEELSKNLEPAPIVSS